MPVTLAIRFDSAKNAEIAAISQMSSSLKPWRRNVGKILLGYFLGCPAHLHGEIEHRSLPRRDIRLAVVDGDLVGDLRVLGTDAQDGAVRDDAVVALIGAGSGDHDHLALRLGQAAVLVHQGIMIGEERTKFVGPICQREKHIGNEPGFFLHRENAVADIGRQFVEGRGRETFCQWLRHQKSPVRAA